MLYPKAINSSTCGTIPSLIESIDCQLTKLSYALYNNTIYSLNKPIDYEGITTLLFYKRILTYKYCNEAYAEHFTVSHIASKVRLLTSGCKTNCLPKAEYSHGTTTTTTTLSPTTTTTTTHILNCEYNGGSIVIAPTTTTTTSTTGLTTTTTTSLTTTTTTTSIVPPIVETYGYLYNWYAATNENNIANNGWHVWTEADMINLRLYIEPGSDPHFNTVGGKLKAIGTTYWASPNTGATDMYNLNFRASGERGAPGNFVNLGERLIIWNTNQYNGSGCVGGVFYNNAYFFAGVNEIGGSKNGGAAIYLKKDTPTIGADGTIITNGYIGNDGKQYNTVIIGGYEYLASPLKESYYRGGTIPIPEVQDNITWSTDTLGARCYYVI